jgi:SHS2 domain-containing protein
MNYKSEEVTVVINISLMGKMSNYSIVPKKDVIKATVYHGANQQHDIQWEVRVKPQQTLEMKYIRLYNKRV